MQRTIFVNGGGRPMIDINSQVIIGPSPIEIYEKKKAEAAKATAEAAKMEANVETVAEGSAAATNSETAPSNTQTEV